MEAIIRMFTPSKSDKGAPIPQAASMPEAPKVENAAETAEKAIRAKKRAMKASESIFTSPLGIGGEASVIKKTLLGQ